MYVSIRIFLYTLAHHWLGTLSHCRSVQSDVWERDLVELILEVGVPHVSHRQRDMLLRQVGVLLRVLDSDIIVREISAFNEHRSEVILILSR